MSGLVVSLELTFLSFLFALPLAILIAVMRLSPFKALRALGFIYVESIRNVPLMAHLLFWYFAAPNLLSESIREKLYSENFEFLSATVALTLYIAAYMAEDVRSGIRTIPQVQFEAAQALGLNFMQTLRKVIIPQALQNTISPLVSQTLNLWKGSSIATVVGVGELMYQAARVESASFRSAEAFVFATLAYLTVSLLITAVGMYFEPRQKAQTL